MTCRTPITPDPSDGKTGAGGVRDGWARVDEKHGGRSGLRRWNGSVNEYVGGEEVEDVVVGAVGVVVAVGGYASGYDHEEVNGYVTEEVEGDDVLKVNPFGPSLVLYLCHAVQHTQSEGVEEERRSMAHDTYYWALYTL